jgi:hypothetical protein
VVSLVEIPIDPYHHACAIAAQLWGPCASRGCRRLEVSRLLISKLALELVGRAFIANDVGKVPLHG